MAGLLRACVHNACRHHRFTGHLFGGRFQIPALQAESYLLSCGRYRRQGSLAGPAWWSTYSMTRTP
jgi:hypothetical protein